MSLPPGLPPLPKSLSVAAEAREAEHLSQNPCTSSTLDQPLSCNSGAVAKCSRSNNGQRQGSLSSTQDSASDRDSLHSRASSSLSAHDAPTSTTTLDTQIATLRREMYSLRQLDLSLLSQLWALNESIQGFRTILQEREEMSPSPTPSNTNSISSEEPEDESSSALPSAPPAPAVVGSGSSASQASTSTSASNSLSATASGYRVVQPPHIKQSATRMQSLPSTGRAHPQLPPILQQRMRRPPPPPPPARGKSPSCKSTTPDHKRPA